MGTPESGTPLGDIRLEDGKWSYNPIFARCGYARDWGVKPSDVGVCLPEEDAAFMIAYSRSIGKMRAYDDEIQRKRMEVARRRGK